MRLQEDIKPGFDAFKEWIEALHKNILTKGAIGRALHYAVNQLPLIEPFFEDGRIHLDNNAIENKIRPLAGTGEEKLLICRFPRGAKEDCCDAFLFWFLQGGRCQSLRLDNRYPKQDWKSSNQ